LQWLDVAARQRDPAMPWIKIDPLIHGLRADPRYRALLVGMKLVD